MEIDRNVLLLEFGVQDSLIRERFSMEHEDWQKIQTFIFEEMERILKLKMVGKEIDALSHGRGENQNLQNKMLLKSEFIRKISNHPVHIKDKDRNVSPSAFIPFCDFGGKMEIVGAYIDHFDYPVCTIFKDKIFNDQLCYEVDLNSYKKHFSYETLKKGFTILVDENRDRFFSWIHKEKNRNDGGIKFFC